MSSTNEKQKKIIEIPTWAIKFLDASAKADGRSTKNFIERLILGYVNDNTPAAKSKSVKK
jgi:hypothetical protein